MSETVPTGLLFSVRRQLPARRHHLPDHRSEPLGAQIDGQGVEQLGGWPARPTEGQFLNPVGEPLLQERAAVVGRRRADRLPRHRTR